MQINTAYTYDVALVSQADTKLLQANPTLAVGDVKVSIDEGAFANVTTLPVVTPAAGRNVKGTLTAAEMNGSRIVLQFVDAAGAEWCDLVVILETSPDTLTLTNIAAAVLAATVETGYSLLAVLRLILSSVAGKISGAVPGIGSTVHVRDVNDTKDRLVATCDASGNRTAVTKDVS